MKKINSSHILVIISIIILIYTAFLLKMNNALLKNIQTNNIDNIKIVEHDENAVYNEEFYKQLIKRLVSENINISYIDVNGNEKLGIFSKRIDVDNNDIETKDKLQEMWHDANFFIIDIENNGELDIGFSFSQGKATVTYLFNYDRKNDILVENRYGIDMKILGNGMLIERKIKEGTIDTYLIFLDKASNEVGRIVYTLGYDLENQKPTYKVAGVEVTQEQWSLFMHKLDSLQESEEYRTYSYGNLFN